MATTVAAVCEHIVSLVPNVRFDEQKHIHLVSADGEPLLGWQRVWP